MNLLWEWLADPAHWVGPDGIPLRVVEHLAYSAVALVLAAVVGIPLGLWIGHTGRGRVLVVNLVNGLRSVPTLGLLFVAVLVVGPLLAGDIAFVVPSIFVLVVLAVPPILAGAYAGVEGVDPGARDAARGMGMSSLDVLVKVEVPCALPLLFSGLRSAALQVVATATLAASVSLGGLGRFLIDGQAYRDYGQMAGGAVLVASLAMLVDLAFAGVQRLVVSPGLAPVRAGRRERLDSAVPATP
ncbi:MAG TPA: ABC transporter permease [Propionicimonas sp.]|jgi:osmoprotectant transport system permease protein|nr:ABC transporter permease [Propionicimonas sp.]